MNTRQKGQDFQRWVKKILEDWGWIVHNQGLNHRQIFDRKTHELIYVSASQDIFGCIDLCAKKKDHKTLWIQATCHSGLGIKTEKMNSVPWGVIDAVQIWLKREDGHVDAYSFLPETCEAILLGKIIRRKFFASAGSQWEF